ncbi:MAG: hypothetical protein JNL67_03890 [Planctomycetaceae bacterium]|nr:hypothetical protein [Planctomycetaceae bacterium]
MIQLDRIRDDVKDSNTAAKIEQVPTWLDPETGRVRSITERYPGVELESGTSTAGRDDAAILEQTNWNWDWLQWPSWLTDFFGWFVGWFRSLNGFGWGLLLLVIAVVFLAIVFYILARTDWGRSVLSRHDQKQRRRKAVSKEELPFELEAASLTVDGLWQQALRAKQQGDFRRAMMYLYSFLLIELDAHQLIRLARGKTNRDYSRELRDAWAVYPCFQATMEAFERVFFGRYTLPEQQVDDLFGQVGRLELK